MQSDKIKVRSMLRFIVKVSALSQVFGLRSSICLAYGSQLLAPS